MKLFNSNLFSFLLFISFFNILSQDNRSNQSAAAASSSQIQAPPLGEEIMVNLKMPSGLKSQGVPSALTLAIRRLLQNYKLLDLFQNDSLPLDVKELIAQEWLNQNYKRLPLEILSQGQMKKISDKPIQKISKLDNNRFAVIVEDKVLFLDLVTLDVVDTLSNDNTEGVSDIAVLKNGDLITTSSLGKAFIWDSKTLKQKDFLSYGDDETDIIAVSVLNNGDIVTSGYNDNDDSQNKLILWDGGTLLEKKSIENEDEIRDVSLIRELQNGNIVTISMGNKLTVWNSNLQKIVTKHFTMAPTLKFIILKNGKIAKLWGNKLLILNPSDLKEEKRYELFREVLDRKMVVFIFNLAQLSNGDIVIYSADHKIRILDQNDLSVKKEINVDCGNALHVLTNDNIVLGCQDGSVQVLDRFNKLLGLNDQIDLNKIYFLDDTLN